MKGFARRGITKKCYCGKEFYVPTYRILISKYCSRLCQNKIIRVGYKHSKNSKEKIGLANSRPKIERVCLKCKDIFYVKSSGNKFYCSKYCSSRRESWSKGKKLSKERLKKITGAKSSLWKGDRVGYHALHDWVNKWLGKPNKCSKCGKIGCGRQIHWANIDHTYRRELSDWLRLCAKCHTTYDRESGLRKFI